MKRKFNIHTCSWPGCGCKTDEEEHWMDAGWMMYFEWDDDDLREVIGFPKSGLMCPHHKDAIVAYENGDYELLVKLARL
jgi:hypothetical protein